ncbi:MAG: DegV family protein [Chloroflexota bacterium]
MSVCILTNNTALFPPTSSSSGRLIRVMPLNTDEHGTIRPSIEDYSHTYNDLEHSFNDILMLTASDTLLAVHDTAQQAAQSHGGTAKISSLDTLQIGPGLGILAQFAARKAATGATMQQVEEYIRSIIPYMFTIVLCSDNPQDLDSKKLHGSEHTNEKSNGAQVYSMEDGVLIPYKKIRTQRHLLEIFQEFLGEFENPQYLAYFHGKNSGLHARPLRETAGGLFPDANFNDLELNPVISSVLGEYSAGLTILEMPDAQRL